MLRTFLIVFAGFMFVAIVYDVERNTRAPIGEAKIGTDFVGSCQTITDDCVDVVKNALMDAMESGRINAECMAKWPDERPMTRSIVIWLNAHTELHPLPENDAIIKAADAIWPCTPPSP